jgi:tetratricopeptide (TPR) repeat protein
MTQPEWRSQLEHSLEDKRNRTWFSLLHLGVMRMEALDEAGAAAAWEESIQINPSACAYRNLAFLRARQKRAEDAARLYEEAWRLAGQNEPLLAALAVEYLQLLVEAGQPQHGLELLQTLPARIQDTDPIQLLWAQIALRLGMLVRVAGAQDRSSNRRAFDGSAAPDGQAGMHSPGAHRFPQR